MTHRSTSLALLVALAAAPALAQDDAPRGLLRNEPGALDGYTLFTPLRGTETHLIDMEGEIVKTWESEWMPGQSVYLLPNGNLLRCCRAENEVFAGGGEGGRVAEYDWDGDLVWEYVCSDESRRQHHDVEVLPNGNVLLIAWEIVSRDRALALGRDEELLGTGHWWPDCVLEVRPTPPKGGEVVWEWHAKDHLIQDRDPEKPNHGDPAAHPERIDVNADAFSLGEAGAGPMTKAEEERLRALGYVGGGDDDRDRRPRRDRGRGRRDRRSDWMHTNSVAYNPALDQIVLSIKTLGEVWIIDHDTTTEEAAGPKGDLLYRWGNPAAWSAGPVDERRLFGQHDARWVNAGDGWNLTIYNNGRGRPDGDWSSVDEIALPLAPDGTYRRAPGRPFGPEQLVWTYAGSEGDRFFSSFISGAERLPNGNTLVCVGEGGEVFEVTRDGEVVWEWHCPIAGREPGPGGGPPPGAGRPAGDGPPPDGAGGRHGGGRARYGLFRATRVPKDAPALAGRSLGKRKSF